MIAELIMWVFDINSDHMQIVLGGNLYWKIRDIVSYLAILRNHLLWDLDGKVRILDRYVVNFMHRTGLLQLFQHIGIEEENDDNEPTGLAALDLGVEDDRY